MGSVDTIKDFTQIFQLHNILTLSKVNGNASLMDTDTLYKKSEAHKVKFESIPFILLYKQYNSIRSTSLTEGLFTIAPDSVGVLDVPERVISPYDPHEIFAISPLVTEVKQFGDILFDFPFFAWETSGITSILVDFGDGLGFRTIAPDREEYVHYSFAGTKYITAQINTGSAILTAKTMINYSLPEEYIQPKYSWNIKTTPLYHNDDEYLGTYLFGVMDLDIGAKIGAEVLVEASCDDIFDKPVIIVEGFDPDGSLNNEVLMNRFRGFRFREILRSQGFDIVYVNFTQNTTYIENNAKVLEEVINKVNEMKTGANPNNIIGFSMGGLITRWCLRDMEDRSVDHDMENFFSYDAPHQGANIPLGLQYIFKEIANDLPYLKWNKEFGQIADAFNSPAARQMLVTRAAYNGRHPTGSIFDPVRAAFAERLENKGYPQQTTNFAIAFGKGNNTISSKNAGNGQQFTPFNPFVPGDEILDGGATFALVNFQVNAYATPQNSVGYIAKYSFQGLTFRKIFGLQILPVIALRSANFKLVMPNSYDDAPGGYSDTQKQFAESLTRASGFAAGSTTNGHDGHNFVPTASALDLKNQNYAALNNWLGDNLYVNIDASIQNAGLLNGNTLLPATLSPFDAVITATSDGTPNALNVFHNAALQSQFSDFIIRNILGAFPTLNCLTSGFCNSTPAINGNEALCTTGSYSASGLPGSITIQWSSMFGMFSVASGQGTPNVVLNKQFNGTDTVVLTLTNSCGISRVFKKKVRVGVPEGGTVLFNTGVPMNPLTVCRRSGERGTMVYRDNLGKYESTSPSIYSFQITPGSDYRFEPFSGNNNYDYFIDWPPIGTLQVPVGVQNSCGLSINPFYLNFNVQNCTGAHKIILYPNSAKSLITIEIVQQSKTIEPAKLQEELYFSKITILDKNGNLILSKDYPSKTSSASIDVSGLKMDVYYVQIWEGQNVVTKKLLIE